MIDPFEKYEADIKRLTADTFSMSNVIQRLMAEKFTLHNACRQTNKGIARLRRRCDSQRRKIGELKSILGAIVHLVGEDGGNVPQRWLEAINGRRPEKAT